VALDVLVAVSERDAAIQAAERRAGPALRVMTDRDGLSLRDAVEWCGGELTLQEATRMRRLVNGPQTSDSDGDPRNVGL
jgi:hypothetical protein